ncbi:NAD(P)/FAD-dependent oxidoreductase [Lentzea sp. HUAS12]|uniref:flavin-containing monooxygenase n=1 Tax=Lentzea sp. HUAS12 TaxID=2951806 RepID=UPI0020A1492A|nr:NAD(P)/FAD-dependent oxidoreductase [Lentzea sp. HUAS12]USX54685.1 NAD(P)/FAD-dependent oxidoreductase [Lentzea sp. HUAS12]
MPANPEVIVIGAGFGGLGVALSLRRAGIDRFTVLERADGVGGVWRENTYPGAACDVPSSLYSYSFAPHHSWPRRYSAQPDILAYLRRSAEEVRDRIRFGATVVAASFDGGRWRVELAGGEVLEADVLVSAVGQLNRPSIPALPGLDGFEGPVFHSARWRHDVDLDGKRVAVVGTGASAVQFVPRIQPVAGQLTVFQRSAPHVLPKPDARLRGRAHPWTARAARGGVWLAGEALTGLLTAGRFSRGLVAGVAAAHRWLRVRDRDLRERLRPREQAGCKRVLFSNDWYPALAAPNVDVVTETITGITARGVRTADGREHAADVLIWGTGFEVADFRLPMTVTGADGRELADVWAGRPRAHLGMSVPGFPSFFLVYGPNTNLGGNSIVTMIEAQCRYVVASVRHLAASGANALDVRPDVAEAFDAEMRSRLANGVWSGCGSWYRADDGSVTTNWPGSTREYLRRTARLRAEDHVLTRHLTSEGV